MPIRGLDNFSTDRIFLLCLKGTEETLLSESDYKLREPTQEFIQVVGRK